MEVRPGHPPRAAATGRLDQGLLPREHDHLPLQPEGEHVPPNGQRRRRATRRLERQANRAEERGRHVRQFSPLNDGSGKNRQEADIIGSGKAWIATNGTTIKGTWKKNKPSGMTHFYDATGKRVTLTVGQTFIQVLDIGSKVTIKKGKAPPAITPAAPATSPTPGKGRRPPPRRPAGSRRRPLPTSAARPLSRAPPRRSGRAPLVGPGRLQRGREPSRLARRDEDAGRPDELGSAPTADATIGVPQASASIAAKPAASDSTGRIAARAPRTMAASRASGRCGA